jgi:hypothetical protein
VSSDFVPCILSLPRGCPGAHTSRNWGGRESIPLQASECSNRGIDADYHLKEADYDDEKETVGVAQILYTLAGRKERSYENNKS